MAAGGGFRGCGEEKLAWERQRAGVCFWAPPTPAGVQRRQLCGRRQQSGRLSVTEQKQREARSLGSTECPRNPAGPSPEIGPWFPSVEQDRQATRTQAHCSHPFFPIALPSRSEAAIFTFSTGEFTFLNLQISEIITAFSLNFSVLTCASIRS